MCERFFCVRKANEDEVEINDGIVARILGEVSFDCFMELVAELIFNLPNIRNYQPNSFTGIKRVLMVIIHKKNFGLLSKMSLRRSHHLMQL